MHAQLYCPAISSQKAHFQQASFTGWPWCFMSDAGSSCSARVYLGPWLPLTGSRGGSRLLDRKMAKPRRQDGGRLKRRFSRGGKKTWNKTPRWSYPEGLVPSHCCGWGKGWSFSWHIRTERNSLVGLTLFPRRLNYWWSRRQPCDRTELIQETTHFPKRWCFYLWSRNSALTEVCLDTVKRQQNGFISIENKEIKILLISDRFRSL